MTIDEQGSEQETEQDTEQETEQETEQDQEEMEQDNEPKSSQEEFLTRHENEQTLLVTAQPSVESVVDITQVPEVNSKQ